MTVLVVLAIFYAGLAAFLLTRRFLRKVAPSQGAPAAPVEQPSSTPFRTLLLVTPADDALTDAAKSVLIDTWGDLPISELASRSVVDLAFEFQATFPSPAYDDRARMRIAEKVRGMLSGTSFAEGRLREAVATKPSSAQEVSAVRSELEAMAVPSKSVDGIGTKVVGGVYNVLTIDGIDNVVSDAIVLQRGTIGGISPSGRIFTAPGVPIAIDGIDAKVKVAQLSWTELAERLRKSTR